MASSIKPPERRGESLAQARAVVRRTVAEAHDRPSLVTEIACDVGAEILEGIRAPGEDLNSVDLSRRYDTSRTPVREALMLLEKEGLIEVPPRRRPRVMVLRLQNVRDIYRTRAVLLELVAGEVARTVTAEQLATLTEIVEQMDSAYRAGALGPYIWADVEFYDLTTRIANNPIAKRIVDSLLLRTIPMRRLSLAQGTRLRDSLADHRHLLQAYGNHDATLAAALIRSNHFNALSALETCLV